MAESSDSSSSWPGLLAELNRTFGLVRDVFGYALPGAVFLAIGVMANKAGRGGFSLAEVRAAIPFPVPAWLCFLGLLAACYATGDVMAGIAYMPISIGKWLRWLPQRKFLYQLDERVTKQNAWVAEKSGGKDKGHKADLDRLKDNPTEVTADLLEIELRHPEFFISLDRRETLVLMSGSMFVALLGGWLVFYIAQWHAEIVLPLAGAILLVQFMTGISHLRRVRSAIREADTLATNHATASPDLKATLQRVLEAATPKLQDLIAAADPKVRELITAVTPALKELVDAANKSLTPPKH
jgi:hypothetical protein